MAGWLAAGLPVWVPFGRGWVGGWVGALCFGGWALGHTCVDVFCRASVCVSGGGGEVHTPGLHRLPYKWRSKRAYRASVCVAAGGAAAQSRPCARLDGAGGQERALESAAGGSFLQRWARLPIQVQRVTRMRSNLKQRWARLPIEVQTAGWLVGSRQAIRDSLGLVTRVT